MDIAKLGISIDPSRAVTGSQAVVRELKTIGNTAERELGRLDRAQEKTGRSAEKTAATTKKSFDSMVQANAAFVRGISASGGSIGAFFRAVDAAAVGAAGFSSALLAHAAAAARAGAATGGLSLALTSSAGAFAAQGAAAARGATLLLGHAAAASRTALSLASIGAAALSSLPGINAMTAALSRAKAAASGPSQTRIGGVSGSQVGQPSMRQARGRVIDPAEIGNVKALDSGLLKLGNTAGALPPKFAAIPPPLGAAGAGVGGLIGRIGAFIAASGPMIAAVAAIAVAVGALIIAFAALKVSFDTVLAGMQAAGPVERAKISFEALTGSTKESIRILDELRKKSRETGAEIESSMTTVKKFTALGFSPDEAIKLNSSILDVAGAVGMTTTEAKELGNALAQVQAKGTVSMEELRQQIAEKGVPVIEELAAKLGVSTGALIKMVSDGKVKSKELIDIFMNLEGSFARFEGGAKNMTKTLPGALDRLKAVWKDLLIDIGLPINTALAPIVNNISDLLEKLKPMAVAIGQGIGNAFKVLYMAISDGSLGQLLAQVLMAGIEQASAWFVVGFVRSIGMIQSFLAQALAMAITLPIDLFVSLFTAAVNVIVGILTFGLTESSQTAASNFGTAMGTAGQYIAVSLYNALGQALENVANSFLNAMLNVVNVVSAGINNILNAARNIPGGEKVLGKKSEPFKVSATMDFFTPQALPDISKIGDQLVGTGARDMLGANMTDKLGDWEKQFGGSVENPYKKKPGLDDPAKEDKGKKERQKKAKDDRTDDWTDDRTEFQKLYDDWTNMTKQLDNLAVGIAQSMSQNITDGLMSIVDGTKSVKQAFSDMATSVINDIVRQIIQMYIQIAVARVMNAVMGVGGVAHTGGVIGGMGTTTTGTATASGGVPTHHTGGMTNSAEGMVKVDRGESILTRRRSWEVEEQLQRARGAKTGRGDGGKGGGTTILNVIDPKHVADAVAAQPGIVLNVLSKNAPQVRRIAKSKEGIG